MASEKIVEPVKVAGNSYYLPAMSNTGLFKDYVIDPGSTGYKEVAGKQIHNVLITHGHNDHFRHACEFRERGARVIASRDDALLVRYPEVNIRGLFSWAKPPIELVTPYFQGNACEVDTYIEEWQDDTIKPVFLPGHTLGQYGFITEDGVFYTADALYSEDLWSKYKLPYCIDPDICRTSLERMKQQDFDYVVPGHGRPLTRSEALKAADYHLSQLDRVDEVVLELIAEPVSMEDLLSLLAERLKLYHSMNNYYIALVMLKGHMSSLVGRGKAGYKLENFTLYWYRT
ncbi:MBL fold metallo-hydrolase [Methanocella sp. MCL-LM]|uniref:MBL fold metallo-hydrolase n=1 Tax=Methanocella sp. MCL-LM TaxID=3412035 RepID=UPI003C76726E